MNYDKTRGKMRFQVGKLKKVCYAGWFGAAGLASAHEQIAAILEVICLFFNEISGACRK
jgi:hypothetical protein